MTSILLIIVLYLLITYIVLHFSSMKQTHTGATLISPDGFFDIEDDNDAPNVKEADAESINERFPKPSSELTDPETWKHHFTDYNSIGRTLVLPEILYANGDVRPVTPVNFLLPLSCFILALFFFSSILSCSLFNFPSLFSFSNLSPVFSTTYCH